MPSTSKATSPKMASPKATSKRYCGLGDHYLKPPIKTVKDEKMLRFANYINPELRSTTPLCGNCFDYLQRIYRVKMRNAINWQKKKKSKDLTNSISDVASQSLSQSASVISAPSTTLSANSQSGVNNGTSSSTSAGKRMRAAEDSDDEPMLSLNAVNGTRLPHIQPIPKRRPTVHLNQPAMDIYLAGTTGG
ncbi:hypothetical protein ACLKA7_002096 [Drosophila subpalustris]